MGLITHTNTFQLEAALGIQVPSSFHRARITTQLPAGGPRSVPGPMEAREPGLFS